MKKGINKSILFYIASVLFFIASVIGFTSGNESSMAIVWLCLGSSFLCLGPTHKKKEKELLRALLIQFCKLEFDLPIFLKSHVELLFHLPRYALLILTSISIFY